MKIIVKVDGKTVCEADLIDLMFQRSLWQGYYFDPPEGAKVEMMAFVNERTWCWEQITMEYVDDEA